MDQQEVDLKQELYIDDSSYAKLNDEFKTHSAKHVGWSMIAARASRKVSELKVKLKTVSAEVGKKFREAHYENTGKPLAATFNIKEILPLDEEWQKVNYELINITEELDIAIGAAEAFAERGYLLKEVAKFIDATTLPTATYKSRDAGLKENARGVED